MGQILAILELLRVGRAVADPRQWATGQVTVNALVPVVMAIGALLKQYGVDMPLSEAAAVSLAGGVLAVVNIVCTVATSRHLGVGRKRTDDGARVDGATAAAPAAGPDQGADGAGGVPPQLHDDGKAGEKRPDIVVERTDPFVEHGS